MRQKIALVGIGKIAVDQHVPALRASSAWELAATFSREGAVAGVEAFSDFDALLAARPDVKVVSLAIPPQPRFEYAAKAIRAGRHLMLEKPPGQTLSEIHELQAMAKAEGVSLYATWHSRLAFAVPAAKAWLQGKRAKSIQINWKEDVRRWHPGQDWVFAPGGMGVFDPGINALSILTAILPQPVHLTAATLEYPANRQTPIAAELAFTGGVSASFDWRQEGPQTWDIVMVTEEGTATLRNGGARFFIGEVLAAEGPDQEYAALYAHMAELVRLGQSDVDLSPMLHVADAYSLGRRVVVEAFHF